MSAAWRILSFDIDTLPQATRRRLHAGGRHRRGLPPYRRNGRAAGVDHARARGGGAGQRSCRAERAALRHPLRGQGQHRRRGPADHMRLPGVRLRARAVRRPSSSGWRRRARSSSARPISTSSPPDSSARARPTASPPASSTRSTSRAARAPARPLRWPRVSSRSRSAPTRPDPAACRRASTTSSASSRPRAGQHARRGAGLPHAGHRFHLRADGLRRGARHGIRGRLRCGRMPTRARPQHVRGFEAPAAGCGSAYRRAGWSSSATRGGSGSIRLSVERRGRPVPTSSASTSRPSATRRGFSTPGRGSRSGWPRSAIFAAEPQAMHAACRRHHPRRGR